MRVIQNYQKSKQLRQSRFTIDHFLYASLSLVLFITLFAALNLSNYTPNSHAEVSDSYATNATVRVASTCSMSANPFSTDTEHTATLLNGQANTAGIGLTTIKVLCNDIGGYSIYAVGYSENILGENKLVGTNIVDHDIPTGTTLDGTTSNWAMKVGTPTITHDATYDPTIISPYNNWAEVPTTYQKVASYTTGTVPSTGGSYLTTTYAASISPTQPAGTYVGKVKYTLVHPSISTISSEHDMQHVDEWAGELLVGDSVIATDSRDGKTYSVARLCMNRNGCSTTSPDYENSMLWMTQNLDFTLSSSTELNSTNTDLNECQDELGNTYNGYRRSNGIVYWRPSSTYATMTTPAYINKTLSQSNQGNNADTITGWTNDGVHPYQAEGGDYYIYTTGADSTYDTIYASLADCQAGLVQAGIASSSSAAEVLCKHYHVGNYYNYTASVAMNDSSSVDAWHENAPNSICPAGWRLPVGLQNSTDPTQTANVASEYNQMLYANHITDTLKLDDGTGTGWPNAGYAGDGFIKIRATPVWLARSGVVNGTALNNYAQNSRYWSSTSVSGSFAYDLEYSSGGLYPAARNYRDNGFSLRCVHDDQVKTIDKMTYMQDFAKLTSQQLQSVKESMTVGEQYQLKDSRDESEYWVAKQADGKVWMTQNLNFAPSASTTYTYNDTDLGYTTGDTSATWQPLASTMTSPATITNFASGNPTNSVTSWTNDSNLPHYAEGTTNGAANGAEVIFYNGTKYEGLTDCATNSGLTEAECKHYEVGNYYNWSAAVASNNTSATTAQYTVMPNSICPAGWRLPKGLTNPNGDGTTIIESEFNAMLSANGVANGTTLDTGTTTGSGIDVGYVSGAFNTTFSNNPLYFVRSGNVTDTTLYNFSGVGYYWSSTAVSSSYAYDLRFASTVLDPAYRYGRGGGFSLRCLAR